MAATKISLFCLFAFLSQVTILPTAAKPFDCGCRPYYGGCDVPVPPPVIPPTISFAPVPQPVPIKVPVPRPPQSVTIPNIILALLPPTNKAVVKPCLPPAIRPPQPIVLPIPQPYPLPIPDLGCAPPPCGCR